jgi:hypothetical protein
MKIGSHKLLPLYKSLSNIRYDPYVHYKILTIKSNVLIVYNGVSQSINSVRNDTRTITAEELKPS